MSDTTCSTEFGLRPHDLDGLLYQISDHARAVTELPVDSLQLFLSPLLTSKIVLLCMDPKDIGQIIRAAREARGLSQAQLGRLIGVKQQSLDAIEKGDTQRSKFLPEIVRELEISPGDVGLPPDIPQPPGMATVASPQQSRDFRIFTAAEGGPGEIIRSTDPIDWWPRPIEVQHVKGAYGMYIVGESMVPEFEPGHVAVVNPNLPHVGGKSYIFYAEDEAGQARATVKRLRRASADTWFVTQHNPPPGQKGDFTLSRRLWATAHRIVGRQDPS